MPTHSSSHHIDACFLTLSSLSHLDPSQLNPGSPGPQNDQALMANTTSVPPQKAHQPMSCSSCVAPCKSGLGLDSSWIQIASYHIQIRLSFLPSSSPFLPTPSVLDSWPLPVLLPFSFVLPSISSHPHWASRLMLSKISVLFLSSCLQCSCHVVCRWQARLCFSSLLFPLFY
jgi:hypothetical protein